MRRFFFVSAILLSILGHVSGKYESGSISNGKDWVFVSEFSFIDDTGLLEYKVEYSVTNECCPSLAYYFHDSYETVLSNDDMDCKTKLSYAEGVVTFQSIAPNNSSNPGNVSTPCVTNNATNIRECSGILRPQSEYDRLWFFVLIHCNSTKGLEISYEFTFTNGESWEKHLSGEDMHIMEMQAVSFAGLLVIFLAGLYIARQLLQQDKLHRVYKLFMMSLFCDVLAQSLDYIHYAHYINNGVQLHALQTITDVLFATSEVSFIILLILLAYGWTILTPHLGHATQMKLTVVLSLYILAYGILFVCKKEFFDPEASHFPFESDVDKAFGGLKIVAWACFAYGVFLSAQIDPAKKKFYLYFAALYSAWFLFLPLSFLAFFILFNERYQVEVLQILRMSPYICVMGFAGILSIMRPGNGIVNFTFHVSSNEVDPAHVQVQEPSSYQPTGAFLDLGNRDTATLNTNQGNTKTGSQDKDRFGFNIPQFNMA